MPPDPLAQPNTPATGAPAISGSVRVGEILTVDTSGIDDVDGLDNVSFSYQWLANDTDVAGATGDSYALVADDKDKTIRVWVSFIDDRNHLETLTSVATAAVTPPSSFPTVTATGEPFYPSGLWSDGETMWVADFLGDTIHAYKLTVPTTHRHGHHPHWSKEAYP